VARYPNGTRGIDTAALSDRAEHDAVAVERGEISPGDDAGITPPVI
jgi:hypothetical protein